MGTENSDDFGGLAIADDVAEVALGAVAGAGAGQPPERRPARTGQGLQTPSAQPAQRHQSQRPQIHPAPLPGRSGKFVTSQFNP